MLSFAKCQIYLVPCDAVVTFERDECKMSVDSGLWRGVQAHLERARRGLDGVFGVDQSVTDKVLGLRRICFDATCYVLEAARSRTFSVFVWSSLSLNKRPDIGGGTCNMT